jgi:hypothetical protein
MESKKELLDAPETPSRLDGSWVNTPGADLPGSHGQGSNNMTL